MNWLSRRKGRITFRNGSEIRMSPVRVLGKDVPRTIFRTRCGHFESVVIPFSDRTNTPIAFLSLMGRVRHSYLDQFVILLVMTYLSTLVVRRNPWEHYLQRNFLWSSLCTSFEIEESNFYDTLLVMWEVLSTFSICQSRWAIVDTRDADSLSPNSRSYRPTVIVHPEPLANRRKPYDLDPARSGP